MSTDVATTGAGNGVTPRPPEGRGSDGVDIREVMRQFQDAQPPVSDDIGDDIADFSYAPRPLKIRMDGEVYDAKTTLPPIAIPTLLRKFRHGATLGVDDGDTDEEVQRKMNVALEKIADVIDALFVPTAAARLRERLFSEDRPLDLMHQVVPMIQHVLERRGLRPTQRSSSS